MSGLRTLAVLGIAGLILSILPGAARAEESGDGARRFVDTAMHDVAALLGAPRASAAEATDRLRALLARYVDIAALGRSCAGSSWQQAEAAQQDGFLATFQNYLIAGYMGSLTRGGAEVRFAPATVVEAANRRALVRTELQASDGQPHAILLAVSQSDDGDYRITDVSAEGISMRSVLMADFSAFLRRNGGRFEALLDALRGKLAARLSATSG